VSGIRDQGSGNRSQGSGVRDQSARWAFSPVVGAGLKPAPTFLRSMSACSPHSPHRSGWAKRTPTQGGGLFDVGVRFAHPDLCALSLMFPLEFSCTTPAFLRRGGQNTRHSRAGGNPEKAVECWIPACAGMTGTGARGHGGTGGGARRDGWAPRLIGECAQQKQLTFLFQSACRTRRKEISVITLARRVLCCRLH
jgi:hypothetical protein